MKSMKFVVDPESRNLYGKDNEDIDNIYDAYVSRAIKIMIGWLLIASVIVGACTFVNEDLSIISFLICDLISLIINLIALELCGNRSKIVGKKLSLSEDELEEFDDLKDLIACDGMDIYKADDQYYLPDEDEDLFDSDLYPLLTKDDLKSLQNRYSQSEIDEATTIIARMERNKETNQYEVVFDLK